jgi:hypothetical protein
MLDGTGRIKISDTTSDIGGGSLHSVLSVDVKQYPVNVCAADGSDDQGSSPDENVGILLAARSKAAGAAVACLQISRHPVP